VSSPGDDAELPTVDDFWQHRWPSGPKVVQMATRHKHMTVREALFFMEYSHFVQYNVLMLLIV